jgi:hypothetical protein
MIYSGGELTLQLTLIMVGGMGLVTGFFYAVRPRRIKQ